MLSCNRAAAACISCLPATHVWVDRLQSYTQGDVHTSTSPASPVPPQVLLLFAVELLGSKLLLGRWALASSEGDAQPGALFTNLLAPSQALHAARQQHRKAGKPAVNLHAAAIQADTNYHTGYHSSGRGVSLGLGGLQESMQQQQQQIGVGGDASPSVPGVGGVLDQYGRGEVPGSPRRSARLQQRSRRSPEVEQQ
jgi:hypothetical protein